MTKMRYIPFLIFWAEGAEGHILNIKYWDRYPNSKELCIKAREKAVACFDIEKVAKQYAELYREILG